MSLATPAGVSRLSLTVPGCPWALDQLHAPESSQVPAAQAPNFDSLLRPVGDRGSFELTAHTGSPPNPHLALGQGFNPAVSAGPLRPHWYKEMRYLQEGAELMSRAFPDSRRRWPSPILIPLPTVTEVWLWTPPLMAPLRSGVPLGPSF